MDNKIIVNDYDDVTMSVSFVRNSKAFFHLIITIIITIIKKRLDDGLMSYYMIARYKNKILTIRISRVHNHPNLSFF